MFRTILLRHVNSQPRMTIQGISTQETDEPDRTTVVADVFALETNDRAMQELMSRLNIEQGVTSIRWEKLHPQPGA